MNLLGYSNGYSGICSGMLSIINIIMFKDNMKIINTTMDTENETISKLKFIGKINKGDKINTRKISVQSDGITTTFLRTFITQDNRQNTLSFIQETMKRSFDLLTIYKTNNKTKYDNLSRDLLEAISGLDNLKSTYSTDIKFCCDLECIKQDILGKNLENVTIEIPLNEEIN